MQYKRLLSCAILIAAGTLLAKYLFTVELRTKQQQQRFKGQVSTYIKDGNWKAAFDGIKELEKKPTLQRLVDDLREELGQALAKSTSGSLPYEPELLKKSQGRQQAKKAVMLAIKEERFDDAVVGIQALPSDFHRELYNTLTLALEAKKIQPVEKEAQRKAADDTRKAEEARIAQQKARKAEQDRLEAERKAREAKRAQEEAQRKATEDTRKAEEARVAQQKAEQDRLEAERKAQEAKRAQEEAQRNAAEDARKAEEARVAQQKAEQDRLEAERKAQEAERAQEEAQRKADEDARKAEEAKKAPPEPSNKQKVQKELERRQAVISELIEKGKDEITDARKALDLLKKRGVRLPDDDLVALIDTHMNTMQVLLAQAQNESKAIGVISDTQAMPPAHKMLAKQSIVQLENVLSKVKEIKNEALFIPTQAKQQEAKPVPTKTTEEVLRAGLARRRRDIVEDDEEEEAYDVEDLE